MTFIYPDLPDDGTGVHDDSYFPTDRASGGATVRISAVELVNYIVSQAALTLAGVLTLAADPTAALGAATKQYVDAVSAAMSSTIGAETARAGTAEAGLQGQVNNLAPISSPTFAGTAHFGQVPTNNGFALSGSSTGNPITAGVDPTSTDANVVLQLIAKGIGGLTLGPAADRGYKNRLAFSSGYRATKGDVQVTQGTLYAVSAANTTPVNLTSDGAAIGASNQICIPATTIYGVKLSVLAYDASSWTNASLNHAKWDVSTIVLTRNTAGTVGATGNTGLTAVSSAGTGTSAALTATVDSVNGGLTLTFTPPTGNAVVWRAVAHFTLLESS